MATRKKSNKDESIAILELVNSIREDSTTEDSENVPEITPVSKKRGRPPKNKSIKIESIKEFEDFEKDRGQHKLTKEQRILPKRLRKEFEEKSKEEIKRKPKEDLKPKPKQIGEGTNPLNMILISKNEREISDHIERLIGKEYFILNENTQTKFIDGKNRKFKTMLVEGEHGFRYMLWFDLSKTSALCAIR